MSRSRATIQRTSEISARRCRLHGGAARAATMSLIHANPCRLTGSALSCRSMLLMAFPSMWASLRPMSFPEMVKRLTLWTYGGVPYDHLYNCPSPASGGGGFQPCTFQGPTHLLGVRRPWGSRRPPRGCMTRRWSVYFPLPLGGTPCGIAAPTKGTAGAAGGAAQEEAAGWGVGVQAHRVKGVRRS